MDARAGQTPTRGPTPHLAIAAGHAGDTQVAAPFGHLRSIGSPTKGETT